MYSPCLLTHFHNFSVYLISVTLVPNWSISRNYKKNWNSTKISVTPGMHRRLCAKATDQWAQGWPSGQTPWPAGPTLQSLTGWLHEHALQEAVTRNPKLEVSGSQTQWPPGHVSRPANTWCVTNLIKSVTPPWTPVNTPLPVEFKIPHTTYSSPLVKVPV
jgi:hypothetical protein